MLLSIMKPRLSATFVQFNSLPTKNVTLVTDTQHSMHCVRGAVPSDCCVPKGVYKFDFCVIFSFSLKGLSSKNVTL